MHIVHVVRQFFPAIGGFESVVLELATRQVEAGHAVRVVTLNRLFKARDQRLASRDAVNGIEIVRIPFVGSSRYPIAPSVLRHLRDADVVHVHAIDFFFDFLSLTRHGKRLVVSTHGGFFHTTFAARMKRFYFATITRALLPSYDAVVAVSEVDHALFGRIRQRGLFCIENGVNTAKFSDAAARAPVKAMIFIGRFSQNKRLDRLIRFFAALRLRDPEWRLVIAGQPWDLSADDVMRLARESRVAEALRLVCQPNDDEIRQLIGESAVIVSSSDYEGFGIAAIEGMSAGLYPLLSGIASFQRLASRTGIGLNVNFEAPTAAADAFMVRWAEIAANHGSMRARAIGSAAVYGWDQVYRRYQSLYEEVCGRRTILKVPVFAGRREAALARIAAAYADHTSMLVAFANANTLNVASGDARFRDVLRRCLVLNDGIGVDAASQILFGSRFPHNLNGTDFVPFYFQHTRHRHRIFFLGGPTGVAERAARRLVALCGGRHAIAGCQNGYASAGDAMAIVAKIVASKADVLLVAMGNPLQELWLAEHLAATGCRLGFGVGALFDFLSGDVARAPGWVRAVRLEWLYRLAQEPSRLWRRYILGNPLFLIRVLGQWWSRSWA